MLRGEDVQTTAFPMWRRDLLRDDGAKCVHGIDDKCERNNELEVLLESGRNV